MHVLYRTGHSLYTTKMFQYQKTRQVKHATNAKSSFIYFPFLLNAAEFIWKFLHTKLEPRLNSASVPTSPCVPSHLSGCVWEVVGQTFDEIVLDKTKVPATISFADGQSNFICCPGCSLVALQFRMCVLQHAGSGHLAFISRSEVIPSRSYRPVCACKLVSPPNVLANTVTTSLQIE